MKTASYFILMMLILVSFSCQEPQDNLAPSSENTFIPFNKNQHELIQQYIANATFQSSSNIRQIKGYKTVGNHTIISYSLNDESKEISFENLFKADRKTLNPNFGYTVYCSGTCDCGLEGVLSPDGQTYVQCKCNQCEMHYEENKALTSLKNSFNFESLALKSFIKTHHKTPYQLTITKSSFNQYENAQVTTLYYKDAFTTETTFMIVEVKDHPITASYSASNALGPGIYTIDCTGTCDCRERFKPNDGTVECTCNPCKMEINELISKPNRNQ